MLRSIEKGYKMAKRTIKIKITDFWGAFDYEKNFITELLNKKYEVKLSDNPDYIISSVFGSDFLKYDGVRIQFTGENSRTDLNVFDYGIGFDYYNCEDRYLRFPLYILYGQRYELAKKKHLMTEEDYQKHCKFCNFVYSNSVNVMPEREQLLNLLDSYKTVDCGGRYRNNVGGPVEDKIKFLENYKFTIAVENTSAPGYTTEKLIEAWSAKTIPIYYGNPKIGEEFNTRAFINCHDYESFDEVMQVVRELDSDEKKYRAMMEESIFSESTIAQTYSLEDTLLPFLEHIIDQPLEKAYRRDRYGWGAMYEKRIRTDWNLHNKWYYKWLQYIDRKRYGR